MSALTPITDIPPRGAEVRFVPEADIDVCCHSHGGACHEG